MSRLHTVKYDAAITLRNDDCSTYVEAQGANEAPTARPLDTKTGFPLLRFERCVFHFIRTESSITDPASKDSVLYGSTVRLWSPATSLLLCVARTESASSGKGYRVAMRPAETAQALQSTFRVVSQMRSRTGSDHVRHADSVLLQLDNSDLYLSVLESAEDRLEIVASMEPRSWAVHMFDEGFRAAQTGFAFASRIVAIEHRYHRSVLTHGTPVRPIDHRRSADRQCLWQADSGEGDSEALVDALAFTASGSPPHAWTSDVYFVTQATALGGEMQQQGSPMSTTLQCSCTALWIVENLDPTTGGPLRVGEAYRLRHVASGRYLTVAERIPGQWQVTTIAETDESFLTRSVFLLDGKAEDDGGHISAYHSFIRLQHAQSSLWLSSQPLTEFSVARTEATKRPFNIDRISLRHPKDAIISKMLLLMGHVNFLREHVRWAQEICRTPMSLARLMADDHSCSMLSRTTESVSALIAFCSTKAGTSLNAPSTFIGFEIGGDGSVIYGDGGTSITEAIPNREHQRMLQELGVAELLVAVLTAPFCGGSNNSGATLPAATSSGPRLPATVREEATCPVVVPFRNGVLQVSDLHNPTAFPFLRLHHVGLALLQLMAKGSVVGCNTLFRYADVLIHFEWFQIRAAHALLTSIEHCTESTLEQEVNVANQIIALIRSSNTKSSSIPTYLKCLSKVKRARDHVAQLVERHEKEIMFGLVTSTGRLHITPPRPDAAASVSELGLVSTARELPVEVTPFELFVAHGEPDKIEGFIATIELLICLASRKRDDVMFRFVTRRITRDQIVYVLKSAAREGARSDNSINIIQALFLEAAMELYLVPHLQDVWLPSVPVVPVRGGSVDTAGSNVAAAPAAAFPSSGVVAAGDLAMVEHDLTAASSGTSGDASFIRQVKASTLDVLKLNHVQIIQQKGRNMLLSRCVKVWGPLLEHGFVTQPELEEVIAALVLLLDGRTDVLSSHATDLAWDRYDYSDSNAVVVQTKIYIIEVLAQYLRVVLRGCVMNSVTALETDRDDVAAVTDTIMRRLKHAQQLLCFPQSSEILLDLVLYQSDELASGAISLLTQLCYLSQDLNAMLQEIIFLPESCLWAVHELSQIAVRVQQKIRGGGDISGDVLALLSVLARAHDVNMGELFASAGSPRTAVGADVLSPTLDRDETPSFGAAGHPIGSSSGRGTSGGGPISQSSILLVVAALGLHEMLLEAMPTDPSPALDALIEFFSVFASSDFCARILSAHWSKFYDLMIGYDVLWQPILRLLVRLIPLGNRLYPMTRGDVLGIVRIFARERYPECIAVLRAMLRGTAARPEQQRDIVKLLAGAGVFSSSQWWLQVPDGLMHQLIDLLTLSGEENAFAQFHIRKIFPAESLMQYFMSLHVDSVALKTLLLRFLSVIHLSPVGDSSGILAAAHMEGGAVPGYSVSAWTANEVWWRFVRDDVSMRLDDLATMARHGRTKGGGAAAAGLRGLRGAKGASGMGGIHSLWRRYTMECARAAEAFFAHQFTLHQAVKIEWIAKDLRSLASSVSQLLFMFPQLELSAPERDTYVRLGRTMSEVLAMFNEPVVSRLRTALNEAAHHNEQLHHQRLNRSNLHQSHSGASGGGGGAALDVPDTVDADQYTRRYSTLVGIQSAVGSLSQGFVEACVSYVESYVRPVRLHSSDSSDRRRAVIEKLLSLCGRQALPPNAVAMVLCVMEQCIGAAPPADAFATQVLFGSCGAMHVATILLDATKLQVTLPALRLGIAALQGGNTVNQNSFLRYFMSNDERFFSSAKRTLEAASLEVKHYVKMKQQHTPWEASAAVADNSHEPNGGDNDDACVGRLVGEGASFPCCEPLLRFLQLLCEGHHFQLQEYCREQRDNLRSVNAVQCCVAFLGSLLEGGGGSSSSSSSAPASSTKKSLPHAYKELESVTLQCFHLLTEFCQGPCSGNQALLVSSDLLQLVERTLREESTLSTAVKSAAVTTLISLVEGCTDAHIAETVIRQLSLDNLAKIFHSNIIGVEEDAVELVFDVGIFLRTMADLLEETAHEQPYYQRIRHILSSRADVDAQTGCIQIQRDDRVELVYFRVPLSCRRIREDSKLKLLWDVDRSSQTAKCHSFVDYGEEVLLELDLISSLEHVVQQYTDALRLGSLRTAVRDLLNASQRKWIVASVVLAFVSNGLLIIDCVTPAIHIPLGMLQVIACSVIAALSWLISGTVYLHKHRRKLRGKQLLLGPHDISAAGLSHRSSAGALDPQWWEGLHRWFLERRYGRGSPRVTVDSEVVERYRERWLKLSRPSSALHAMMCLCALLGLWRPAFYAAHLFWCIQLSPSLQNVIAAVTQNRRTLAVTLFLGMLFCYAFSLIGFALFPDDFDVDDDESTRENCDSLLHCFVFIATTGLRQGGGVGDVMKHVPWTSTNFVYRRVFDFLYFSMLNVVFLNILFGIVIDSFSELRDAKQAKELDIRLRCFICGISSHVFDQYGDGFAVHTKLEHNMWQYLYFMQHLRLKDPNDYTGQETYVAHKLSKKDFSFFPQRSITLEKKGRQAEAFSKIRSSASSSARLHERGEQLLSSSSTSAMDAVSQDGMTAKMSPPPFGESGTAVGQGACAYPQVLAAALRDELRIQYDEMKRLLHHPSTATVGTRILGRAPAAAAAAVLPSLRADRDRAATMATGVQGHATAATPLILTGGEFRLGENVGTQTAFVESVVGLENELSRARREAEASAADAQRLRGEMRLQFEEIRRLEIQRDDLADVQQQFALARNEMKEMTRTVDLLTLEREAALRQSAFLQQEITRLTMQHAKLSSLARSLNAHHKIDELFGRDTADDTMALAGGDEEVSPVRRDAVSESDASHGSESFRDSGLVHRRRSRVPTLEEYMVDRSRRYEDMALDDLLRHPATTKQ